MGVVHDEWQAGLVRAMLAKRADGLYAAGIGGVVVSIARQVGKTFTIGTVIFALCVLFPRLKVLWTAHRTRTSNETFRSLQGFARRKLIAPYVDHVRQTNGEQEIGFKNGSRILFGARESGFGRGFDDVDMEVFDEAQILTQKALDDMVPATNVAANPLILFLGTPPKPTDPSEAFTGFRARALAGGTTDLLYVEVAADPGSDLNDRKQWAKANPSYPHRTKETAMLRMRQLLGDESFIREGMGIWDEEDASSGAISSLGWAKSAETVRNLVLSVPDGPVSVGLAFTPDHEWASIVWSWSVNGLKAVDVVRHEGTNWVLPYLVERSEKRNISTVSVDQSGPAGTLLAAMGAAGLPVRTADTLNYKTACADFADAVKYDLVVHRSDPDLDRAASRVKWRKVGDGQVFARRDSGVPIDPIEAAALAVWGMTPDPKRREFFMQDLNAL